MAKFTLDFDLEHDSTPEQVIQDLRESLLRYGEEGYGTETPFSDQPSGLRTHGNVRDINGKSIGVWKLEDIVRKHSWHRSTFAGNTTCSKCGLLPIDVSDWQTNCPEVY